MNIYIEIHVSETLTLLGLGGGVKYPKHVLGIASNLQICKEHYITLMPQSGGGVGLSKNIFLLELHEMCRSAEKKIMF